MTYRERGKLLLISLAVILLAAKEPMVAAGMLCGLIAWTIAEDLDEQHRAQLAPKEGEK